MARVSIAYAHPPSQPEKKRPLAVLAQDDETVVLEMVPQNVLDLADMLGLPSQTFVGWLQANRRQIRPEGGLAVTDRKWLERYIQPGYVDTLSYGPILDVVGPAEEVAKATAQDLAQQQP